MDYSKYCAVSAIITPIEMDSFLWNKLKISQYISCATQIQSDFRFIPFLFSVQGIPNVTLPLRVCNPLITVGTILL